MIKKRIIVPGNVRYISEWEDFELVPLPHILDKKIPGCGFTEWILTNKRDSVLCSPRRLLLENKEDQHPGEVFYFRSELDRSLNVDKDLITTTMMTRESISEESRKLSLESMEHSLMNYINYRRFNQLPVKIIVTYDSFRLLKEMLSRLDDFSKYQVIVDEFQSIFTDSRFKSDTELEFLNHIQGIQCLCFVSATPMIDTYLEQLKEFKDLPYYELDWEEECPGRVLRPDLKVRVIRSVIEQAVEIIRTYKSGEFEMAMDIDSSGNVREVLSKEAVIYVNSVKNIVSIIKKSGLTPDEVNILCANTPDNQNKLNRISGKGKYIIGKVPLRGEPHKMFTLCTRTVYLGADFYSDNARTFILSDANIETLAVDITLDLPQILGRQRLLENPWKNRAELYFKSIIKKNIVTKEEFDKYLELKISKTESLLTVYNKGTAKEKHVLAETYQTVAKTYNYKDNYVAVNTHGGTDLFPVRNDLVLISEKRAFDIQQVDYKDRFTVFNKLADLEMISCKIQDFIKIFNTLSGFHDKMKAICESPFSETERLMILEQIPLLYKNMYLQFGSVRLKAKSYNITNLRKELEPPTEKEDITKTRGYIDSKNEILNHFSIGSRYTLTYIKETLGNIYRSIGYKKTPKASDLIDHFNLKKVQIITSGKKSHGYEILSKKD